MRKLLRKNLSQAFKAVAAEENLEVDSPFFTIEKPPRIELGDYSSNIAMQSAKLLKRNPRDIAQSIAEALERDPEFKTMFRRVSIEGPGFLNFYLSSEALGFLLEPNFSWSGHLKKSLPSRPEKVMIEFVSANPTGPLNIVSARAAVTGDAICRIMRKAGYSVHAEYYVNDYGNQVRLLGLSFAIRFLQERGLDIELPEDAYQGEYIRELVHGIVQENPVPEELLEDPIANLDKLGEFFAPLGVQALLETHKKDLRDFNTKFDHFFSEASLHHEGAVTKVFEDLKHAGKLYQKDGAWFFKSTEYGDDKDRVVLRADGRATYLLADIAYHKNKVDRGFQEIYDIWGPDHHGYINRLEGALKALGFPHEGTREKFEVWIVQQVNMLEDGKPVVMSKRLGKFQTMRDLIEKVPIEVSRYFFLMRSQSSHLDFDLELAIERSARNPVYYIQYAHARVHSIFREAQKDFDSFDTCGAAASALIDQSETRRDLLTQLARYADMIEDVSGSKEVHIFANYLYETASLFTKFYHDKENRVKDKLTENLEEGIFLLSVCKIFAETIREGLDTLGISAPREM